MSLNPITVDSAFTTSRHGIYYTVTLSLCIHLVVLNFFTKPCDLKKPEANHKYFQPMKVKINLSRKTYGAEKALDTLREIKPTTAPKKLTTATAPTEAASNAISPHPLRIDNESIRAAVRSLHGEEIQPENVSENGVIVFDKNLLRQLNRSSRSRPRIPNEEISSVHSSFSGGAWTDHIQLGDSCFRVTQADPLDPLSREIWYKIKCSL